MTKSPPVSKGRKKVTMNVWIEKPDFWLDDGEKYGIFVVGKTPPTKAEYSRGTITYSL